MGVLIFGGLVLALVVVIGFMIYGAFLGLALLGGHLKRLGSQVMAFDREAPASAAVVELVDDGSAPTHCWELKDCSEIAKQLCPAYQRPDLPCWLANMETSEQARLKSDCLACSLFNIPALMTSA